MSRNFKNKINLRAEAFGQERRKNLSKEVLSDSTPLPKTLEYKDIDEEFKRWVEEDLAISFEGERVPTIVLFSNQRFSEYMQSWQDVDEKKNLLLNFKAISRENNPKAGTILGDTRNIPGGKTFLMKRVLSEDRAGRRYFTEYRMKQPVPIDLIYTVSIVTNKYEFLNKFNQMMNEKFCAIDCYIRPNGHFIPMTLKDISDESEYSIDNRQFYSQSYNITVKGYIITEDSMEVEEKPYPVFCGFEGDVKKNAYAEIEELPCDKPTSDRIFKPIVLTIHFGSCTNSYKFKIDTDFHADTITLQNIRSFSIYVNDKKVTLDKDFNVIDGDEIKIKGVSRYKVLEESVIRIEGFDGSDTVLDEEPIEVEVKEVK